MSTEVESSTKPNCVVIDTNIWCSELLLKTPVGASFVYAIGRQHGFIGFPEVVGSELKLNLVRIGLEAAKKFESPFRTINTLTGSLFPVSLPTEAELERIVTSRITELKPILIEVPFTLEHAKAALEMVNMRLPPNGIESQQFKDCAIWQAVLSLVQKSNVYLVTNDRAFLRERSDASQGLALNLQEDCRRVGGKVEVFCDLGSCLKAISGDLPSYNRERLLSLILESALPQLRIEAAKQGYEIGELDEYKTTGFRTEKDARIAVDYSITFQLDFVSSRFRDERSDCHVTAHGSCYYDLGTDSLSGHFIEYVIFKWRYPRGGRGSTGISYGREDASMPFPRPEINLV